jgi:hypothetical protein
MYVIYDSSLYSFWRVWIMINDSILDKKTRFRRRKNEYWWGTLDEECVSKKYPILIKKKVTDREDILHIEKKVVDFLQWILVLKKNNYKRKTTTSTYAMRKDI